MKYVEDRTRMTGWIREQLVGPSRYNVSRDGSGDGVAQLHGINPVDRFPCGAIYPVFEGEGEDPAAADAEPDELDDGELADEGKEPEAIRRFVPPSSIGISFYTSDANASLEAAMNAARYEYDRDGNVWKRSVFEEASERSYPPAEDYYHDRKPIWSLAESSAPAAVDFLWRRRGDGWIVTVTLCNTQVLDEASYPSASEFARVRAEKTLFEAKLELRITDGVIGDYPRVDRSLLDEEEQEIELQYKSRKVYAIGHGTGAAWQEDDDGAVRHLNTDAMPTAEVPQVTADIEKSRVLELRHLAKAAPRSADIIAELEGFIGNYASWAKEQEEAAESLPDEDKPTSRRITSRMRKARARMAAGLELLAADDDALLAFALANQAIFSQMKQADKRKGKSRSEGEYRWRPFQLAFLLATIESASNENSEYRDVVDLIWFPTGGGKTEAYFGLISYVILLRRLRYPNTSGGTTALMRYTLRLLTKDQFVRAARLICALELIRKGREDLGDEPVSIGMWVGGEASPNHYEDALSRVREASVSNKEPSLVVDECPWCGQAFSCNAGNYDAGKSHFYFRCKNKGCEFGRSDEPLPCNIVDDFLYDHPPTLIVGTIDKFARMPWEERVGNFFGTDGNRPPELIIQDELHLISGALGSTSGIYEAAIDSIIKLRGLHPKYVASTATIRTADKQIRKLYGRESAVFPPPGTDCDDSYFARTIPTSKTPGRLYVGYSAPMLNRQKCLAPLAAAILAAPLALFINDQNEEALLDAWWTSVIYHGSLKGLANSQMSFDSDVRDWMLRIIGEVREHWGIRGKKAAEKESAAAAEQSGVEADDSDPEAKQAMRIIQLLENRMLASTEELTSHKTAEENAETFSRLAIGYPEDGYIDAALATNMVSVGLDVSRLALMVVNGQPLTTAEYIQASSRVGRGDVPGIVYANYYRDQARSLSHYEQFRAYHGAFYRYVEPTSVTPFTWQARRRALHAALVSVIRHGVKGMAQAGEYSGDRPEAEHAIKVLIKRCEEAEAALGLETAEHISLLSGQWEAEAEHCAEAKRQLKYYNNGDRAYDALLGNYDDKIQGLWPTLQSMRNVEDTALLREQNGDIIPIRLSHLLGYSGPGAVVRGPDSLMVVQDSSSWTGRDGNSGATRLVYVERAKRALGIEDKELMVPPTGKVARGGQIEGGFVPAMRFPQWMRCPRCGRLYRRSEWKKQGKGHPVCTDPAGGSGCEGTRLEQVQHVMVHPNGYLADVRWHFLAHKSAITLEQQQCKVRDKLVLDLETKRLRCESCNAIANFNEKEPQSFGKNNQQPWLWDKPAPEQAAAESKAHIRKVNDSLVYSPTISTALVIPPESRVRKGTPVDLLYRNANDRELLDSIAEKAAKAKTDLQRKKATAPIKELAKKYRCTEEEIKEAFEDIKDGYPYYGRIFSDCQLLEDEYKAFLENLDAQPDEDFVTHNRSDELRAFVNSLELPRVARNRAGAIDALVKVDRLKEVRVFKGFKRDAGDENVPPDISGEADWLPAIELYGEGIFFTLEESIIAKWEQTTAVKKRIGPLERRFGASRPAEPSELTARFLLLHTLAHLLIRQIEAVGGYPAASLSERLYCGSGAPEPMAGILIYTSAPDKTGTLGGLAELSDPQSFLHILTQALDHAEWCSSDPVCGEHEGQGPQLLNLAACHACTLIPDTACAYGNALLDRVLVSGGRGTGVPSLFARGDE